MIIIRKPYQKLVEGEMFSSIIGFSKRDWFVKDGKIIQWNYNLFIDLWLIMIRIKWLYPRLKDLTKERKDIK